METSKRQIWSSRRPTHLSLPSPGSVVKFDLSVTAPAVSVAQLSVDQLPTGWTTTLRGGGFVVNAVTAAPDTPGKVTVEVDVPADAAAGSYPMQVIAADGAGQSTLHARRGRCRQRSTAASA